MSRLLAIDLGTSSTKAVLFDGDGTPLRRAIAPHRLSTPRPGWAEADPEGWWRAVASAVREAVNGDSEGVAAVGLSGQMHGVVLCLADGRPLRPAVTWADARGADVADAYDALPRGTLARLANPVTAGMAGTTLAWFARHEPNVLRAADRALQPKDWLRLRLTGEAAAEPSDASGTLLYDLERDAWAEDVADALGVPARLLAPLRPSASAAGALTRGAAASLGLPVGVPVATGAGDTPAALLGSGLGTGEAQLSIGTGAQLVVPTEETVGAPGEGVHLFRRAERDGRYLLAAVQNAGLALDWAGRMLDMSPAAMVETLATVPPGAEGATFLPYLTGERTPIQDASVRGGWSGLALRHGREAMARAVLEGIAFGIADATDAAWRVAPRPPELRLVGGGSVDALWRQLLADVLVMPLTPTQAPDASARGAARLAAEAIGTDLPPLARSDGATVAPRTLDAALAEARVRFRRASAEAVRRRRRRSDP